MSKVNRRDFVKTGGALSAAAFMSQVPLVYAGGQEQTIRIALVGCGGRGTGAAENCLSAADNVQLVALGDMFKEKVEASAKQLKGNPGFKVVEENFFHGFDAYKKVLQTQADLVLFATPPGFRPMHFAAAVEAGKHVFIEKPCAVDPAGVRKVIETGKKAAEKKLAVVAGTQYRHQTSFMETIKRVHDGMIGDVISGRAYYNTGALWYKERAPGMTEMEWQLRNWLYFDWLSGDHIVEQHIHTIDVTDWVMNSHPVSAVGTGGRAVRTGEQFGNIWDHFTIDYEYPKKAHVMSMARQWANTANHVGAEFQGTKGSVDTYKAEITDLDGKRIWKFDGQISIAKAYVQEHTDLINSIRAGKPLNESEQVAHSTLTAILGREAAYTGKKITWQEILESELDLSPEKYEMGDNPVRPVPVPGKPRA
ncbi:MAG TPA: Gfo/Idh/MocA family oxidoreductase [Planctomycetota bacterium]|nr:Gfo/Idh/MocA family oxidoreductase [Planctomycetota bacterium]